ncbi:Sentrin-specific protease 6 [Tulasnella sp. 417]|nr:Sentrin-specific protease 6 [Tulasnella sp. 417]
MSCSSSTQAKQHTYNYDSDGLEHVDTRIEQSQPDILVEPNQVADQKPTDNPPRPALQRTYEMKALERPLSNNSSVCGDLVASHRFYGSVIPASIDCKDLQRLEPGQWLTVDLVNFYVFEVANSFVEQNPGFGRAVCALPESIWSGSNSSQSSYSRLRWDNMESPLDFDFVVFAGNCTNSHFYLCIIAYASDILADRNPTGEVRTVGLVLNSLRAIGPSDAPDRFRNVILRLGKTRPIRKDGLKKLAIYYPEVPQQQNIYDCGLYPGYLLSIFLSDPDAFTSHCMGKSIISGNVDRIWDHEGLTYAREQLHELVMLAVELRAASQKFNTDFPPAVAGKGFY